MAFWRGGAIWNMLAHGNGRRNVLSGLGGNGVLDARNGIGGNGRVDGGAGASDTCRRNAVDTMVNCP